MLSLSRIVKNENKNGGEFRKKQKEKYPELWVKIVPLIQSLRKRMEYYYNQELSSASDKNKEKENKVGIHSKLFKNTFAVVYLSDRLFQLRGEIEKLGKDHWYRKAWNVIATASFLSDNNCIGPERFLCETCYEYVNDSNDEKESVPAIKQQFGAVHHALKFTKSNENTNIGNKKEIVKVNKKNPNDTNKTNTNSQTTATAAKTTSQSPKKNVKFELTQQAPVQPQQPQPIQTKEIKKQQPTLKIKKEWLKQWSKHEDGQLNHSLSKSSILMSLIQKDELPSLKNIIQFSSSFASFTPSMTPMIAPKLPPPILSTSPIVGAVSPPANENDKSDKPENGQNDKTEKTEKNDKNDGTSNKKDDKNEENELSDDFRYAFSQLLGMDSTQRIRFDSKFADVSDHHWKILVYCRLLLLKKLNENMSLFLSLCDFDTFYHPFYDIIQSIQPCIFENVRDSFFHSVLDHSAAKEQWRRPKFNLQIDRMMASSSNSFFDSVLFQAHQLLMHISPKRLRTPWTLGRGFVMETPFIIKLHSEQVFGDNGPYRAFFAHLIDELQHDFKNTQNNDDDNKDNQDDDNDDENSNMNNESDMISSSVVLNNRAASINGNGDNNNNNDNEHNENNNGDIDITANDPEKKVENDNGGDGDTNADNDDDDTDDSDGLSDTAERKTANETLNDDIDYYSKHKSGIPPTLSLLVPTKNREGRLGEHLEYFMINPQMLYYVQSQSYYCLGRIIGIAVRSCVPLHFDFPMWFWHLLSNYCHFGTIFGKSETKTMQHIATQRQQHQQQMQSGLAQQNSIYHQFNISQHLEWLREMDQTTVQSLRNILDLDDESMYNDLLSMMDIKHYFGCDNGSSNDSSHDSDKNEMNHILSQYPFGMRSNLVEDILIYELYDRYETQMYALIQGLSEVIPLSICCMFSGSQFKHHICGESEINISLLKNHTSYRGELSSEDELILNFWSVLESFDNDLKADFVDFVYAQKRLPSNEEFQRRNLRLQISVLECENPNGTLPESQTCFLNLRIPRYSSKRILRKNLLIALKSSSGFGEEHQDV